MIFFFPLNTSDPHPTQTLTGCSGLRLGIGGSGARKIKSNDTCGRSPLSLKSPSPILDRGKEKRKGPGREAARAPGLSGGRCREGYFAPGRSGAGPPWQRGLRCRCPGEGGGGSRRGGGRWLTCAASSFVSCSGLGRIWTFSGRWRRHPRNLRRDRQRPWAGAPSPPGTPGQDRPRRLRSLRRLRPKVSLRSRRGRGRAAGRFLQPVPAPALLPAPVPVPVRAARGDPPPPGKAPGRDRALALPSLPPESFAGAAVVSLLKCRARQAQQNRRKMGELQPPPRGRAPAAACPSPGIPDFPAETPERGGKN